MEDSAGKRPSPDELLERIKAEGDAAAAGKLKIYLGMAAGVGKTFAMLTDVHTLKTRGIDIIIGYVEPHGRAETEKLLEGLEQVPQLRVPYGGAMLGEFDIDAVLRRKPAIVAVDELAHTNAPGCRHPKRWQDILELLKAGISVHTTVNIQHLESVRDIVAQITGVIVQETVPDTVFARANEIEVVDLPPDELLHRLREGKIYSRDRIDAALSNFFKEGNLLALRELVLRHSAQSVDAQMQRFRRQNEIQRIWPAADRLMVLVGPTPMGQSLVRYARRLANNLNAEILAVTFESQDFTQSSPDRRALAIDALRLADSLGCRTFIRHSRDLVADTLEFVREHNVTGIVVGKSIRPRWRELLRPRLVDELLRHSKGVSVHVVSSTPLERLVEPPSVNPPSRHWVPLLVTLLVCLGATAVAQLIFPSFELANLIMIYLLGVTWVATRYSYREALVGSIFSVALFDFFFVPPRYTFAVSDAQYLVTFSVMLGVSILISGLTQQIKHQAQATLEREQQTSALFVLGQDLLRVRSRDEITSVVSRHIARSLGFGSDIIFDGDMLHQSNQDSAVAAWVLENNQLAGIGSNTLPGSKSLYLPLGTSDACHAVLKVTPEKAEEISYSARKLVDAYAAQISLGLERLLLEDHAQRARVSTEREQLKNLLLSSISHDLRTPLTVISGASTILLESHSLPREKQEELLLSIKHQSERLSTVVRNVLDLTKFEAGDVKLTLDWYSLEELVGAALNAARPSLGKRPVNVQVPQNLPLIKVDGVLFEQVLVNLFENIGKHTPADSQVSVTAKQQDGHLVVSIEDTGPGFEENTERRVFDKLYTGRGQKAAGMGLGLTICRAIVESHKGTITARNRPGGGACIEVSLPIEIEERRGSESVNS